MGLPLSLALPIEILEYKAYLLSGDILKHPLAKVGKV
jgi:hypothetical protein